MRKIAYLLTGLFAAAGLALGMTLPASAATHHPGPAYVKADVNGQAWQFDTDNPLAPSLGANYYSNTPVRNADGSESLGRNGVNLRNTGASGDSGVVVYLGHVDSLTSLTPAVTGHGLEGSVNLYVGTSGGSEYFGAAGFPYADLDGNLHGDVKFSVAGGATSTAELGGYTGESTLFTPGTSYTLAQIKSVIAARIDGGVKNPMVWAWIGVGDVAGVSRGYVTSVDGQNLVSSPAPVSPSGTYDLTDAAGRCLYSDQVHGRKIGSVTTSQVPGCTTVSLVSAGHGYYQIELGGISLCADVALNGGAVYSNSCTPTPNGDWKVSSKSLHGKYEVVPLSANGSRLETGKGDYLFSLAVPVSQSSTWTLTPVS